jgi:hypothetical protein
MQKHAMRKRETGASAQAVASGVDRLHVACFALHVRPVALVA